jgi:hypothetical protein
MVTHLRVALIVASLLAVVSCSSSPTVPSTASVAGTWGGTNNPPLQAPGFLISYTIEQSGSSLSGRWDTLNNGGTLSGEVTGTSVSLTLIAVPLKPCPTVAVTAIVHGNQMNQMSGTTRSIECPGETGRVELTRR